MPPCRVCRSWWGQQSPLDVGPTHRFFFKKVMLVVCGSIPHVLLLFFLFVFVFPFLVYTFCSFSCFLFFFLPFRSLHPHDVSSPNVITPSCMRCYTRAARLLIFTSRILDNTALDSSGSTRIFPSGTHHTSSNRFSFATKTFQLK